MIINHKVHNRFHFSAKRKEKSVQVVYMLNLYIVDSHVKKKDNILKLSSKHLSVQSQP